MSKLDELIRELCPDGVEYKTLGEIAVDIYRGAGITRDQVTVDGTPCVRYGEIYTTYGVWFDKCVSHTDEAKLTSKKYFEYGDVLFAITGESVDDIAKCCAYIGHEKCLAGGDIVVLKHNQDPKYLSYVLATTDARQQKSKGKVKSKVVHSSVPAIREIKVPIPPIEIQREIVRILDDYTENIVELQNQLTAEITARQKQYEFYRDKLLTFDVLRGGTIDFDREILCRIADLGKWSGGKTPSMAEKKYWESGTIPWVSSKDVKQPILSDTIDHITNAAVDEASMTVYPAGSVAIVTRSGILRHTFPVTYIPFETTVNQDIKILVTKEGISSRYVSHALQAYGESIRRTTKKQGGTVDSLDFQKVLAYKIPVPPLDVQNRIVNVLDNFEKICSDLNIGLPAEIEARQKQYEYYRDKLLTFKEVAAT
ncbi:restriction endonuclease subunit S [Faecalibacterium prausnitzii]|jgi:type I restriction enzyme S subunit|uniref:Type I restriction modification DNA specificity domain protein n=1 Tax=Faecalibacterium prausnitzii M21/2 TaxID=411485 RepID=A8SF55_9FIRM|nr:restriction endonuclease subunit S [Faecalibacterium prausnitzii]EDP19879.1 type I restriction modification DNA specificity domain protein [Faecalibacterium prausnitzii M21/2]